MSKLGGIGDILGMMKNAKQIMEKAKGVQEELAKKRAEGTAGAGLVTATVNGNGDLIGLKIDKSVVNPEDIELLSDLIVSAVADGRKKSLSLRADLLGEVAGDVDLSALGIDKSMLF